MFRAPLGRSLQPMARMMAPASMVKMPSSSLVAVISLSGETDSTMVFSFTGMPSSRTCFSYLQAYSGPVSSSPKRCRPKPLWMHCCRMPPSCPSRSRINMSLMPLSYAATAALIPAGPPPMITKSVICFRLLCRSCAVSCGPFPVMPWALCRLDLQTPCF